MTDAARRVLLGGCVQGVGFRPFVWRLAQREGLGGWVRNLSGQVEILAQGSVPALDRFTAALLTEAPSLARPSLLAVEPADAAAHAGFAILPSDASAAASVHLPPDRFACDACLAEMADPGDRRFGYPFINCTQCGPRYTLIVRLPYDRPNTTMAGFPLCAACAAEYADPASRRFHAEPMACPDCGPRLRHVPPAGGDPLDAAIAALRRGAVLGVKGIGGYHLMCDAHAPQAIAKLRLRKHRPHKPLALMLPPDDWRATLHRIADPTAAEAALLGDPIRPIVLVRKRPGTALPEAIAPGVAEFGVMLPYSPLHHALLQRFGDVLVATSGNLSGEPVLTDDAEAEARLGGIADGFLHHDRPIERPADDPVYRVIAGHGRPLRLGRGNAPLEIELPFPLAQPTLAFGGQMKATLGLGWGRRAVVSPHLGEMDTPRGLALLQRMIRELPALYGVTPALVVHDAHPGYAGTRLARTLGLPTRAVLHHAAHASALAAEFPAGSDWIVFAWDGAGFGSDGTIWGGEALVGAPGRWIRRASLRPFSLLGGDKAARQPWRSALALTWEARDQAPVTPDRALLRQAWERGVNCPRTSSAGRLFDAAAALLGLVQDASHEGQAGMLLESAAIGDPDPIPLPLACDADGLWRSDWAPLLAMLTDASMPLGWRAACLHSSLAAAIVAQAEALRSEADRTGVDPIGVDPTSVDPTSRDPTRHGPARRGPTRLGLTGGVFQNRRLAEAVIRRAEAAGFSVHLPERVPVNDAGLSFGQLVEAAAWP